jgi:hypothetical protein
MTQEWPTMLCCGQAAITVYGAAACKLGFDLRRQNDRIAGYSKESTEMDKTMIDRPSQPRMGVRLTPPSSNFLTSISVARHCARHRRTVVGARRLLTS